MESSIISYVIAGLYIATFFIAVIVFKQNKNRLVQSSARLHKIWEQSFDGMRLIDNKGYIISVNAAFCSMFGLTQSELIGKPYYTIYQGEDGEERLKQIQQRIATRTIEQVIEREAVLWDGTTKSVAVSNSFIDVENEPTCVLSIFRDTTAHRRVEREREELITKLEDAAGSIKALTGLLPICSSCKKIRNDHGYWDRVDLFIAEHTNATFTHGLCPDCLKNAYDELEEYKSKLNGGKTLPQQSSSNLPAAGASASGPAPNAS